MIIKTNPLRNRSALSMLVLAATLTLSACSSSDDEANSAANDNVGASEASTAGDTDGASTDTAGDTDGATDADSDAGQSDTDGDSTAGADTDGGQTENNGDTAGDTSTAGESDGADAGVISDDPTGGDADTLDTDADGISDATDNCVFTPNEMQLDSDGDAIGDACETRLAFAATASFPTGQIERISLTDGYVVNGTYPATESDIRVKTDGTAVYQLGRFQLDSLTKFDANDTSIVEYQYSLNGEESAVNPSDVIFVNDTKAYVLRYGSPTIWIINPSAQSEDEFQTGEIDISAYDPDTTDEDLSPNPDSAVIVDGKLFVLMQRLSGFSPIETGYVAVFDVDTDEEIDTGKGADDGLRGIPLGSLNPTNIRYNASTDEIYVTGRGNIFVEFNALPGDPYTGGLFAIDQNTFDLNQLLDDGTEETNNGQGFIERTLVLNDDKGYVSFYTGSDPVTFTSLNRLHTFNPGTGEVGPEISAVAGQSIATLSLGSDDTVWVGVSGDTPGFTRLDTASDTAVEPSVSTSLSPLNVIFMDAP